MDRCADSISTPLVKSVTCIQEVGNLVCAILKDLAHNHRERKGLRDRRLRYLGRVLLDQFGHDRRQLRAHPAPVGDAVVLQVN